MQIKPKFTGVKINHIKDNFYLIYDEERVYHVENDNEIVMIFQAESLLQAKKYALYKLSLKEIIYELNVLMIKINGNNDIPHSEKYEIISSLDNAMDILKFNILP